jgi:hypothetical protein
MADVETNNQKEGPLDYEREILPTKSSAVTLYCG